MPHINYSSTVWDGCSEIHLSKLNSLHRHAAKLLNPDKNFSYFTLLLSAAYSLGASREERDICLLYAGMTGQEGWYAEIVSL